MQRLAKLSALLAALFCSTAALGDPITIEVYPDNGDIPGILGGYATDPYTITDADGTIVSSITTDSGNVINLSPDVMVITPDWVDDPDGDKIFGVSGNMVTLDFASPLAAISFMIHSDYASGGAWVSADWVDSGGNGGTVRNPDSGYFAVNQGQFDGVGVGMWAEPGACITSITIEPYDWGFGSLRTADATPCTSVPEPGTLSLLGIGLLGLGFSLARRRPQIVRV